ncbi:MAG: S8 family serine peptidase [Beijerinckiaceae bacterium]
MSIQARYTIDEYPVLDSQGSNMIAPFEAVVPIDPIEKVEIVSNIDPIEPVEIVASIGDNESFGLIGLAAFRQNPLFQGINGDSSVVVVIDTGADLDHPEFSASGKIAYSYDFYGTSGAGDADANDVNGHGSHVAGIIAGTSFNIGIANGARLVILKVSNEVSASQSIFQDAVASALNWVASNPLGLNISAVNMSFGSSNLQTSTNHPLGTTLAQIKASGVALVAAAGTGYSGVAGVANYAADPSVWAVGATYGANVGPRSYLTGVADFTTISDQITSFSQRSPTHTDLFAPGSQIISAWKDGQTALTGGTSQAAAHVSGLVALAQDLAMKQAGVKLGVDTMLKLIRDNAVSIYDGAVSPSALPQDPGENDNVANTEAVYRRIDVNATMNAIVDHFRLGRSSSLDAAGNYVNSNSFFGWRGNDVMIGRATADLMQGGDGNDTFNGGADSDTLVGGAGNDTYIVDSNLDAVIEVFGQGTDTVSTTASFYELDAGLTLENLTYTGTGPGTLYGNSLNNILIGNDVGNSFNGFFGADTMTGGAGADYFYIDQNDLVAGGAGYDAVFIQTVTGTALNMGATQVEYVVGGSGSDTITGGAATSALSLLGGEGADILTGGLGDDYLYGNAGADIFRVTANAQFDAILDFVDADGVNDDRIDVRALGASFDSLAEVLAATIDYSGTSVINFGAGNALYLYLIPKTSLTADDFIFT